jgi:hypothetical protein
VAGFRSASLSHETITLNEDKTLSQLVTAPLQKHAVVRSFLFYLNSVDNASPLDKVKEICPA